jgi:ribosomal protein S18 acetylase RimI-like enzyme
VIDSVIQDHLRASTARRADAVHVGGFVVGFERDNPHPHLNWATPVGGPPGADDVAALIDAFTDRGRRPRLEYVPAAVPGLDATLLAAGFREQTRTPVLTCGPDDLVDVPPPEGFTVAPVADDAELRAVARMEHEAYGEPAPPTEADVARLRATIRRGGTVVHAVEHGSGACAAAGLVTAPVDGLAELAAVATAAAYRRRGLARAVASKLTALALAGGASLVYLEAEGPAEQRIYERAGYRLATEKVAMIR